MCTGNLPETQCNKNCKYNLKLDICYKNCKYILILKLDIDICINNVMKIKCYVCLNLSIC